VALVIAALLASILLAVVSPGGDAAPELAAEVPVATSQPPASLRPGDTRVPSAQPVITSPKDDSVEREWDIAVTVNVPQERLPARVLSLVVMNDGKEVKRLPKPARGKSVTVPGVPLEGGRNVLTTALEGPGGRGPASAPVVVHQDRNAPELRIVAPESGTETYDDQLDVVVSSEPGAALVISNQATKRDNDYTVGPNGTHEVSVRLAIGRNRISVTSTDDAGMKQEESVLVVRHDGRPVIKLSGTKQVKRAELPARVRFVVDVKDAEGEAISGATVTFTLGGPGWAGDEFVDTTSGSGRAVWQTELVAGASQEGPRVTVEVVAPNGERDETYQEIKIS
jgi:hypothetical protein